MIVNLGKIFNIDHWNLFSYKNVNCEPQIQQWQHLNAEEAKIEVKFAGVLGLNAYLSNQLWLKACSIRFSSSLAFYYCPYKRF